MNQSPDHRPQDDLPYEQQMRHIILSYRQLTEKLEYIVPYTKKLEKEIERLKEDIAERKAKNKHMSESLTTARREVKRLQARIDLLNEQIEKLKKA